MCEEAPAHGAGVFFAASAGAGSSEYPQTPAFCAIREFAGLWGGQSSALSRPELGARALKHRKARVAVRYAQDAAPGVADDACGLEHHLLHHRLDVPAQRGLAQRTVALVQRVLPHDAQQVHRRRRQRTHPVIGGELARGQTVKVHVGLELGMKLLVRGVVAVQRDHLLVAHLWPQRGGPALQHVLGQEQRLALFVEGVLGEPVDAAQRTAAGPFELKRIACLIPQTLALALSELRPHRGRIGAALRRDLLHRRCARVPLDQQIDLRARLGRLLQSAVDQVLRAKARVRVQQRRGADRAGRAQRALDVVFALQHAVLAARALVQFQTVAACARVQRNGAVAVDPGVGPGHAFLGGLALVHHEGVDIQRQMGSGLRIEVDSRAVDAQPQDGAVDAVGQLAPLGAHGIKALAQGHTRRHGAQIQRLVGKALGAKAFDCPEGVLAQGEQGQVALEDVAVGNASTNRIRRIDHRGQVDALEQAPNQRQTTVATQIVRQLLDHKIDRFRYLFFLHPLGARQMGDKRLICTGIYPRATCGVTDSGWHL